MPTTPPENFPTKDAPAHLSQLTEQQSQLYELITAIWPSAPANELAAKASLSELVRLVSSDELPPDKHALLTLYLYSLPGYGLTGAEQEVERHHGLALAFLQTEGFQRAVAGAKAAKRKTTADRFNLRTRWSICQTLSSNWRLLANVMSVLIYGHMIIEVVRGLLGYAETDLDAVAKFGVVAVALALSARCAKHVGVLADYKLRLLDGPTPSLPIRHAIELLALSVVAFTGSLVVPMLWETRTLDVFLYLTSAVAMMAAAGALGPRRAKSFTST